jgi:hypothetical protein
MVALSGGGESNWKNQENPESGIEWGNFLA